MAIINCPECGGPISEKATECIHCGKILKEEPVVERRCKECGGVIFDNDIVCTHCGCPIEDYKEPQKVEVTNVKLAVNKKKRNIIIAVIAILVIGCVTGVLVKQQLDKKHAQEVVAIYKRNLNTAVTTMLSGAAKAETAGGLIHDVWYNAIYEKSDINTDKFTKEKSKYYSESFFVDDFNTALGNLFMDSDFTNDIKEIKANQEEVQKFMKDLKNPPEEYQDAYDALKEFYDAYTRLVGCAVDPTGNLSSYTSDFNEADTNTMNCYKAVLLYTED